MTKEQRLLALTAITDALNWQDKLSKDAFTQFCNDTHAHNTTDDLASVVGCYARKENDRKLLKEDYLKLKEFLMNEK